VLRSATDHDRDRVLRWRNHPVVRAASLTRHEISAQEHAAWWNAALADPTRRVLVYERREVPAGVVTFFDLDPAARSASWGYYLDDDGLDATGQLLMAWIEIQREAVRYAFDELELDLLEGEVLASNEAVRRLNRRQGFTETGSYQRDIDGEPSEVVRVQLRAAEVRQRQDQARKGSS
jgi:UDP-4-amino-4,6-dideoxy-N-acetyl-beta-L-altrosamine N-acetyltransferase